MMQINMKRCLSLVLALALTFSMLPVSVLAEEEETQPIAAEATVPTEVTEVPSEAPEETTVPVLIIEETAPVMAATESTALQIVQAKMDDILEYYLGTADLTAEEAVALVAELDPYDTAAANMEVYELEYSDEFQSLTEDEQLALVDSNAVFCTFAESVSQKAAAESAISTFATTVTVLDGQVSVTDTANKNTVSNGTVTITASGGVWSQTTNTVTITNETENQATLCFDYSASNYSSFSETSASGSISVILEANESITMSIKGKKAMSSNTATLTLSNFSLTVVQNTSNVTFEFDSNCGGVTVDGTAVTSGTVKEVSLADGATLVATALNSSTFYGWVDASTGLILSTEASYTLTTGSDMTVMAVFVGANNTTSYWGVAGATSQTFKTGFLSLTSNTYYTVSAYAYLFDDLNEATTYAANSSSKYIVPLNSCTLSAGDYEIPSGVTLLIPFDDANTLYTTAPQSTGSSTYTKPSAYRTLTLEDGASLTVNGSMSISGKHIYTTASSYNGSSPSGTVGFVTMEEGSSITVNGNLYAYGYITGSGTITANSTAKVYELFQIADFRGGSQTTDMENKVFPLSQYYIQNIEVPLTLKYGATEYCYATIYMSSTQFGTAPILIGSGEGMFAMNSGSSVTKDYDESTDRLCVEVSGSLTMKSVSITMNGVTVNSSDYVLPVTNNASITIKQGSVVTIGEDIAMLPGSKVIIEEGATVTLASGKNLYIYDTDQWGTFCGSVNKTFMALRYAPGREYTRSESDIVDVMLRVDGTMDVSDGNFYTTASGANINSTGTGVVTTTPGTETVTYQLVQGTGYTEIPITPAQLKNRDSTYLPTDSATITTTYYYDSDSGKWHLSTCKPTSDVDLPTHLKTGSVTSGCECYDETTETIPMVAMLSAFGASAAEEIILDLKFLLPSTLEGGTATVVKQKKVSGITDTKTYTISVANKTVTPATDGDTGAYFDSQGRFIVSRGIASGEMTRDVSVIFKDRSGNIVKVRYGNTMADIQDSVARNIRDYSELVLDQGDEKQQSLIKALLTYGGYAQLAFDVDSGNPAYGLLTEKGIAIPTLPGEIDIADTDTAIDEVVSDGNIDETNGIITKSTLDKLTVSIKNQAFLDSAIYFRVYFTLAEGESIDSYTVSYNVPVANKDGESVTLEPVYDAANARYYVDIPDIPSGYLDYPYSITFEKDGQSLTVKTSVLAYLKRLLASDKATDADKNLAKAMYLYNRAANTYFNR